MFGWIKRRISARWACWRINRWLGLRKLSVLQGEGVTFTVKLGDGGLTREEALRRSFLTPERALMLLDEGLGSDLSRVGLGTIRGGTINMSSDFAQTALLLTALADLAPVLPSYARDKVAALIEEQKRHNWGGVARGAMAAWKHLEGSGCLAKTSGVTGDGGSATLVGGAP